MHTPQPQHLQRIKDLEDEVRRLTVENTQMRGELEKAQRRWEKLKEGARRRRAPATNGAGIENPTIPEEREEEREDK
jgi:TolA-binding protein